MGSLYQMWASHFFYPPLQSSTEAAKDVLRIYDLQALISNKKFSYNFLDIGLSPYSYYQRELRKLSVVEIFSIKRVQSFQFIRKDEVGLLLDNISQATSSANPINLTHQIFAYNASIIFKMALGYNFRGSDHDKDSFHCQLHDISSLLGEFSVEDGILYVGWIIDRVNGHHKKLEIVFHELDTIFQNTIHVHLHPKRNN